MGIKFKIVVIGGTFDFLHSGHRTLLLKAFEIGKRVLIGLCSDEFVRKLKKPHNVAPYAKRLEDLNNFLKQNGVLERAEILPLNDPYGVTLSKDDIEAIVVTEETERRAREINEKRKSLGMPPLQLVTMRMILSEDRYPISSTRIWFEEIDQEGNLL